MAEEIINAFSRIDDLRVAARASAFQFQGKAKDIRNVGKMLDVQTGLDRSVRSTGILLRITAQLVDVKIGFQIWSERYDRELEDVFAIQDEISQSIVEALQKELGGEQRPAVGSPHSDSIVAYRFYLKGRHNWYTRENESPHKAVKFFEQAVEEDPGYALAWAAISNAYGSLNYYASDPDTCRERAGQAIEKAVTIGATLPEVQAAVGFKEVFIGFDWELAESALKNAIEGNSSKVLAHCWYSFILTTVERFEESIAIAVRASEIDPLSSYAHTTLGLPMIASGQLDNAIRVLEEARELDADFLFMLWVLGAAYGAAAITARLSLRPLAADPRGQAFLLALGIPALEPRRVEAPCGRVPTRSSFDTTLI
jgi:tetratricopeptide (TPR) repeat protein